MSSSIDGTRLFGCVDRHVLRAARQMDPILEWLERESRTHFERAYFDRYEAQVQALRDGEIDYAWMSPTTYVRLRAQMDIQPLVRAVQDGRATYRSLLIVSTDSAIDGVDGLRGKRVAFTTEESTSGHHFPRAFLSAAGLNPEADFAGISFSGGHYNALYGVVNGQYDAAFVEDGILETTRNDLDPTKYRILTTVATIPHGPIVAHPRVPLDERERVSKTLVEDMINQPELMAGLAREMKITGFVRASDQDYADVARRVLGSESR